MNPQAAQWTDEAYFKPYALPRRGLPHNVEEIASVLVREQSEIRAGAGKQEAILPISRLMRKLGKTTYRLWAVLLTMRDEMCETHPSLPGLSRASGLSMAQTAKSMARLRQFKLVEDFGFIYRRVPCSCKDGCWGHKVYIRNVYGLVREIGTFHYVAVVPRETARLVEAAAGQGGARKGAGRPRKAPAAAPESAGVERERNQLETKQKKSKVVAYKYQELVSQRTLTGSLQNAPLHGACNSLSPKAGKEAQTRVQALARFLSSPPKGVSVSTLQPKAQPDAPALAPTEEPAAPATAGSGLAALVDGKPCDIMDALTAAGAKCITIGGGYKGPHQRYTSDDLRAASELSNQVAVVKVPPPPKVTADLDDASRLDLLRRAYCATHEKVMRHAYWRPAKRQSEKERGAFLAACAALLEKDISPTAWAKFSFYQWQRTGRKTAPTPTWVWSVKRIALHSGWARTAVGTLASASASPLPATKALIERLALLRSKLGWGRPTDEVVSEVLPAKEREALLALQARQVATWKQNIERSIRNGEWVWG